MDVLWKSKFNIWLSTSLWYWIVSLSFCAGEHYGIIDNFSLDRDTIKLQTKTQKIGLRSANYKPDSKFVDGCKVVLRNQLISLICVGLTKLNDAHYQNFMYTILSLAFFITVEEVLFYYTHRTLHNSFLYRKIHKIHHEWTLPIAPMALYAHPIEHIFANILPVLIGPMLINSDNFTTWCWIMIATTNTTFSHSGYFSTSKFHDLHHRLRTVNYGVLEILDYIHKTHVNSGTRANSRTSK